MCDVIGNGAHYVGQTVTVRGFYTSNIHYGWITNDPCAATGYPLTGDAAHPDDPRAGRAMRAVYERDRRRARIAAVYRARVAERRRAPGEFCAQPYCDRYYLEAVQLIAVDPGRRMTRGPTAPK